jgi:signal transduction histidine kinase
MFPETGFAGQIALEVDMKTHSALLTSPRRTTGHEGSGPDALWSRDEIEALLRVSAAVAADTQLGGVLEMIAAEACRVSGAKSASVLLSSGPGELDLAAAVGLSADYTKFLQSHFVSHGLGPAGAATASLKPTVIEDMRSDPRVGRAPEWRRFALREKYLAMVSVPLVSGQRALGALNLYRIAAGSWPVETVELLTSFGRQAASAIASARLIDGQRRQLVALERIVSVLRDQAHEYANRLHAVSGLLAFGATAEAQRFLAELISLHHENYAAVVDRLHNPLIAGLMLAEMDIARQRGIDLKLHAQSQLTELPHSLGDAEAVTILANLIENAVEAVLEMPASRRKVTVRIVETDQAIVLSVRDWGRGVPADADGTIFARGFSSKPDHSGVGLALVAEAVASARGSISVRRHPRGVTFRVELSRD